MRLYVSINWITCLCQSPEWHITNVRKWLFIWNERKWWRTPIWYGVCTSRFQRAYKHFKTRFQVEPSCHAHFWHRGHHLNNWTSHCSLSIVLTKFRQYRCGGSWDENVQILCAIYLRLPLLSNFKLGLAVHWKNMCWEFWATFRRWPSCIT